MLEIIDAEEKQANDRRMSAAMIAPVIDADGKQMEQYETEIFGTDSVVYGENSIIIA